jgi:hypothetical protein
LINQTRPHPIAIDDSRPVRGPAGRLPGPLHSKQIDTVVMARLRNYWVYSVGLLAAWLIVLTLSTVIRGTSQARAVYIAFLGFAIGWASTTIARYTYPPPAKWNRSNR